MDMDWIATLKAQQADFIERLKYNCLLHCDKEGLHSELTIISGYQLKQLRDFCWEMIEKYKARNLKNSYINNLKGKLGEEAIKLHLGNLVSEVNYEKYIGGDGKTDFYLTNAPEIGIQVKSRYGSIEEVQWYISKEEIEKNSVLVCVLIKEELNESQAEYNVILAGFVPTYMIDLVNCQASYKINELLYCGGLRSYLDKLVLAHSNYYLEIAKNYSDVGNNGDTIINCKKALECNSNCDDAYIYLGFVDLELENKQSAIENFSHAIRINPNNTAAYSYRASTKAFMLDNHGAIQDYTQLLNTNSNNANTYYERAKIYYRIKEKEKAIDDIQKALDLLLKDAASLCLQEATDLCSQENAKSIQEIADIFIEHGSGILMLENYKRQLYSKVNLFLKEINEINEIIET